MEALKTQDCRLYTVRVPSSDAAMFRSMTRRMGWEPSPVRQKRAQLDRAFDEVRQGKTRLQLAIEEARKGPTFQTNSIEELMEHLMK